MDKAACNEIAYPLTWPFDRRGCLGWHRFRPFPDNILQRARWEDARL